MTARQVQEYCVPSSEAAELLKMAMTEFNFSARAYDRIVKVARTIADMDGMDEIGPIHISEAIQYRSLDRSIWT